MNNLFFVIFFSITLIFANNKDNNEEKWKVDFIPIKGQIKNKKYVKAGILALTQSYSVYKYLEYKKDGNIAKRNTYAWWVLGIYFYGIIDSYVDHNFKNFPTENNKGEE